MSEDDDDWGSPPAELGRVAPPAAKPRYRARGCGCRIDWNSDCTAGLVHELCAEHELAYAPPWQLLASVRDGLDRELHDIVMAGDVKYNKERVTAPVADFAVGRKRA